MRNIVVNMTKYLVRKKKLFSMKSERMKKKFLKTKEKQLKIWRTFMVNYSSIHNDWKKNNSKKKNIVFCYPKRKKLGKQIFHAFFCVFERRRHRKKNEENYEHFRVDYIVDFFSPILYFIKMYGNRCRYEYMKSLKFLIKIYSTFIYLSSKTIKNRVYLKHFYSKKNIFFFNENE